MKCDSEKALEAAGSWGLFQKLLVAQCFFYAIPTGFSTLHFALSHFEPTHHCRLPEKYYNFSTKVNMNCQMTRYHLLELYFEFRIRLWTRKCFILLFRLNEVHEVNLNRHNAPCTIGIIMSTQLKIGQSFS